MTDDDVARAQSGPGEGASERPGEDETQVRPGADEATTVSGEPAVTSVTPPEEPPTRVLPGEAATRAMPTPAAPVTPPALGAPPARHAAGASAPAASDARAGRRVPRIVWFAIAGVLVGLGLAGTFALLTRGPDLEPFIGTWGPTAESPGPLGGLVIEEQGETVALTAYSTQVEALETVATKWEGDDLVATLADGAVLVQDRGAVTLRIAYSGEDDRIVVTITRAAGDAAVVQRLARVSALGPGPAQTAPPPSATATPTGTPTATPTATGSPTASPPASPDAAVRAGVTAVQVGVLTWAADHGGLFPAVALVAADGEVGDYVDPWPTNPFTESPMQPGTAPGDYTYEQLEAGRAYRLTGFLGDGSTFVVP